GAIVLAGTPAGQSLGSAFQAGNPAEAFGRLFLVAAASMSIALIAIVVMEEKPLQTGAALEASERPAQAPMRPTSSMRDGGASSVCTAKRLSTFGPKVVLNATSAASRPRAITIRPMRGTLCRASNAYQRPPR